MAFGRVGGRGVVVAGRGGGREVDLELAMEVEVEEKAEAEVEVEVEVEMKVEFGSERGGTRRGCEPPSDVADAAENETEVAEALRESGGSGAAGSCGAAGCHRVLLFSSQPRCSLRLLRVMESDRNNRPRHGLPTSGPGTPANSWGWKTRSLGDVLE